MEISSARIIALGRRCCIIHVLCDRFRPGSKPASCRFPPRSKGPLPLVVQAVVPALGEHKVQELDSKHKHSYSEIKNDLYIKKKHTHLKYRIKKKCSYQNTGLMSSESV